MGAGVATNGAPSLTVAEVFGPTIQGEGPSLGRRASFVRLGGCNLHCVWCDTPYTWDPSRYDLHQELAVRPVRDILAELASHHTDLTVITGGEPLLAQRRRGWVELLAGLSGDVEVETNGTLPPTGVTADQVTRFNVSPKLAHAGDPVSRRIRPDVLAMFVRTGRAVFKFVATGPSDLDEVAQVCGTAGIPPRLVWVMPEGTSPARLAGTDRQPADLTEAAIRHGYNVTTRLHVLVWGEERGR